MANEDLDALLVEQSENRRWLTGFTGSAGVVIVTQSRSALLADSRYYEQVEQQAPDFELVRAGNDSRKHLAELLEELGVRRVGIEAEAVTVARFEQLRKALPDLDWVPTTGLVAKYRAIKTAEEITKIARCAALGDRAMESAFEIARRGRTEKELAGERERFMREHGADGMAFPMIVGSGPNGALPHHATGDRAIGAGEPIVIDMGASIDGYNGDLTRTFSLGPALDEDYEAVYHIVEEAAQTAIDGTRAGVTGREADALARDVITAAGYGEYFGHGLGHGVGLNVHELPRLGVGAGDDPLRAGMVITIEPGIYLPGRFGVRIEDLAVVRDDGLELLSQVEKRPVVNI
jgi:Xaa-Pro aminopeptidase